MRTVKKYLRTKSFTLLTGAIFALSTAPAFSAEPDRFSDRLRLDLGSSFHLPASSSAGIGGVVGFGIDMRDFVISLGGKAYLTQLADTQSQQLYVGLLRIEPKFTILPGLITLLPSIAGGIANTKIIHQSDGAYHSEISSWIELGVGADISITQEISLLPRLQYAMAKFGTVPDSQNISGFNFDLTIRYAFGQTKKLPY